MNESPKINLSKSLFAIIKSVLTTLIFFGFICYAPIDLTYKFIALFFYTQINLFIYQIMIKNDIVKQIMRKENNA